MCHRDSLEILLAHAAALLGKYLAAINTNVLLGHKPFETHRLLVFVQNRHLLQLIGTALACAMPVASFLRIRLAYAIQQAQLCRCGKHPRSRLLAQR
jgi:hypothetical protein